MGWWAGAKNWWKGIEKSQKLFDDFERKWFSMETIGCISKGRILIRKFEHRAVNRFVGNIETVNGIV